jgi:nucleoid-associated protein YgaU
MDGNSWTRPLRGPFLALLPAVVEFALVRMVGAPAAELAVVRHAAEPTADAVAVLLAAMTLTAQLLAGYLIVVVVLRLAIGLPGAPGRLAGRCSRLVTLPVVRRAIDAALGGVLLTQVVFSTPALAATSTWAPADRPAAAAAAATSRTPIGPPGVGIAVPPPPTSGTTPADPATTRGIVPLPAWAGGARPKTTPTIPTTRPDAAATTSPPVPAPAAPNPPSHPSAEGSYTVRAGDTLWRIARDRLDQDQRSDAHVQTYCQAIYAANRAVIGDDPDLIYPGQHLRIPPPHPPSAATSPDRP